MKRVITAVRLGVAASAMVLAGASLSAEAPALDRPELGLQGQSRADETHPLPQPYSKGIEVIGRARLGDRDSNLQLSWVDNCAYVSTTSPKFLVWGQTAAPDTFGVAVIDVRNPRAPRQVGLLRDKGSLYGSETMYAVSAGGRKILAAGSYGAKDDAAYTDLYDVSDCTKPRHVAEIKWPEAAHTLTLSPNGLHLYATDIDPFTGKGGIMVMDITDLRRPKFIGKFPATRPDGTSFEFAAHEISISPDETRIYAGVISSTGGDLNQGIKIFPPNRDGLGPNAGGIYIFDNSDIAAKRPNPALRLIGTAQHGGWHSVMPARLDGKAFLVAGGELGACPGAWPKLVDISDEKTPVVVGEFRLEMNKPENCPPLSDREKLSGGISGDPGTATLHFNDVDSSVDTRLGLFNFMWAGLRIADLRDPANPIEIAYFKPGDACGGHVRYRPKTGEIWVACQASGFHVLRLQNSIRLALNARQQK